MGRMRQKSVEIESLGSIFKGPWDKRYWSSSRGKNRYPFPVGYKALMRNGIDTYTMEIREDRAGPLFVVSCGEIERSGPSANAAWKAMIKTRHAGTRSLGATGEEMFGFTDPVVQYLLRELVSSSSKQDEAQGKPDNLPSSSSLENEKFRSSVIREGSRKRVLSPPPLQSSQRHKTLQGFEDGNDASSSASPPDLCTGDVYVSDSEPEVEPKIVPDTLDILEAPHREAKTKIEVRIVPDTLEVLDVNGNADEVSTSSRNRSPQEETAKGTRQQSPLGFSSEENQNEADMLASSMISLLLPGAVPLMKKRSRTQKKQKEETDSHKGRELETLQGAEDVQAVPTTIIEQAEAILPGLEQENLSKQLGADSLENSVAEANQAEFLQQAKAFDELEKADGENSSEMPTVTTSPSQKQAEAAMGSVMDADTACEASTPCDNRKTISEDLDRENRSRAQDNVDADNVRNFEESRAEASPETSAPPENTSVASEVAKLLNDPVDDPREQAAEAVHTSPGGLENQLTAFPGFNPISKELSRSDMLRPIAAFEHAHPVLCATLNARSQEVDIDICVCCGTSAERDVQLYVYRISVASGARCDAKLVRSLCLTIDGGAAALLQLQGELGVRLAPDGDKLLLPGAISLKDSSEFRNQLNVVRVLSLGDSEVKQELHLDVAVRCLLVTGPSSLIAAGDGGRIKEWQMDSSWRHLESETELPPARYKGVPFRSISKLVFVPPAASIVLGCDADGYFAVWDISKKQLLSSSHVAGYVFSNIHAIDLSLLKRKSDAQNYDGCICLLANVTEDSKQQKHWRMIVMEDNEVYVGNELSNRICAAAAMGRYGVAGTDDGRVFLWDFSAGRKVVEMFEQESKIAHITTTTSSRLLLTAAQDGRIVLYM